jgi:hypothetical protein
VTHWDDDGYPDVLVVSSDGTRMNVFLNRITESRREAARERMKNPTADINIPEWQLVTLYETNA